MSKITRILAVGFVLAVIAALLGSWTMSSANAQAGEDCVPSDAWTETIEHPAGTHVVHHEAVTHVVHHEAVTHVVHHDAVTHEVTIVDQEAVPAIWANWQPNDTHGPQDYVPVWPSDERGTWIVHDQGIPPGHEGPDGVYQQGGGNSPWFYRQAAVAEVTHTETVVDQEAWDETVVDQEAWDETVVDTEPWTETIEHPAVTCEPDEPDTPVTPHEPENPVVHHNPPAPKAPSVPTVIDAGL